MSHPQKLNNLTTREAIIDAVYRSVIAFDRNDISLLKSAVVQDDISVELKAGDLSTKMDNFDDIINKVFNGVGVMDTTHMLSNFRVDIKDGAETAFVTCYALAQHCPPGRGMEPDGPKYLVGGEYLIDMVLDKADGLWKMKKWVLDAIWRQGDQSVMGR